jgi:hypothetical protein
MGAMTGRGAMFERLSGGTHIVRGDGHFGDDGRDYNDFPSWTGSSRGRSGPVDLVPASASTRHRRAWVRAAEWRPHAACLLSARVHCRPVEAVAVVPRP